LRRKRDSGEQGDVRGERAAVHVVQAHAELTGELGAARVTAGLE
jgi:thiamine pyrophosphate-dependent acetolactate synthase large subunit-like protein